MGANDRGLCGSLSSYRSHSPLQHRIVGKMRPIVIRLEIAQGDDAISVVFQVFHVLAEHLRWRADPWMHRVRDTVELQHDDLAVPGSSHDFLEVFQGPAWVGIAGGRDEEWVVLRDIEQRADLNLAVGNFGLHSPARQLDAVQSELVQGFRTKVVPWPRKAD